MELAGVTDTIAAFRESLRAVSAARAVWGFLPSKKKRREAKAALANAEKKVALLEAEMAKALGYEICHCTFPPPVMVLKEGHDKIFKCPGCGREQDTSPACVTVNPEKKG
jgi:hypothetical protein